MNLYTNPQLKLLKTNRNILFIFIGMLISRLGDGIYSVALITTAYGIAKTGSGTGQVLAAFAIANFIFGSISGVFSDKINRKKLIVWSSFICGCIIVLMSIFSYLNMLNIILLAILSFLLGAATMFFEPTMNAILPTVVKKNELTIANSTIGMTDSIGYLAGPALGGILLTFLSIEMVLLINALTFIIAMIFGLSLNLQLALGQLIGYSIIVYLKLKPYQYLLIGYSIQAIGFTLIAVYPDKLLIIAFILFCGIAFGLNGATFNSLLQDRTPNYLLGRVYGVNYTLSGVISPVGRSLSGIVSDYVGTKIIFLLMGVIFTGSSVLSLFFKKYLDKQSIEDTEQHDSLSHK